MLVPDYKGGHRVYVKWHKPRTWGRIRDLVPAWLRPSTWILNVAVHVAALYDLWALAPKQETA